jgi:hypothetical protein
MVSQIVLQECNLSKSAKQMSTNNIAEVQREISKRNLISGISDDAVFDLWKTKD